MFIYARDDVITYQFIARDGTVIDTYTKRKKDDGQSEMPLVRYGSDWKYLSDGSNQGTAWRKPSFDDSAWREERAQLGYGDNDETTPVGFGPNASSKFVTTYFRRTFNVPADWIVTNLTFRLVRDDGAVVWLNGREAYRSNMPGGVIAFNTLAAATVDNADEDNFFTTSIAITNLPAGPNIVGVEVHQRTANSSDISFDLELSAIGYTLPIMQPRLAIVQMPNGDVRISWPTTAGWNLVTSSSLNSDSIWTSSGVPPTESGGDSSVILTPANQSGFYQLSR
jgi:hypothetical protein